MIIGSPLPSRNRNKVERLVGRGYVVQGDIGLLVTDIYGNRTNFEITNKHDFESFVNMHNLQQVDLKIVKLEETI